MNILFLSTENPFPVDHGHHIRTFHVLKALAAEHKIHFVGFAQNDSGIEHKHQLFKYCETVDIFRLRYRGWQQMLLLFSNLFSQYPLIIQKYYDVDAVRRMQSIISQFKIDLVHFDMLHLAKYREHFAALPCILVNHNVESLRLMRWAKFEKKILLKAYLHYQYLKLRHFESRICPVFDNCTVVSNYDKSFLQRLCRGGEYATIPNGVDTDFFHVNGCEIEPNSLIWTGSLQGPYNLDAIDYFFQSIWPEIISAAPETKTTIVGVLPHNHPEFHVGAKNVTFTGYVDDVRPYVAKSAVFIAPLRSGSGTKIKVLNAMAQGKAVVTTSVGAEGIEARDNEEILIADSPGLFAEKTLHLLRNPQETMNIGLRARKVIEEKYDWEKINRKIGELYNSFDKNRSGKIQTESPILG